MWTCGASSQPTGVLLCEFPDGGLHPDTLSGPLPDWLSSNRNCLDLKQKLSLPGGSPLLQAGGLLFQYSGGQLAPFHIRIICRGPHTFSNLRHRSISLKPSNPRTPPSKHASAEPACQGFGQTVHEKDWAGDVRGKGGGEAVIITAIIKIGANTYIVPTMCQVLF